MVHTSQHAAPSASLLSSSQLL